MATNGNADPRLSELQKLVSAPPAFKTSPPPIYRGPESDDEDADGYPPAPVVKFTGRRDADGQPELVAEPVRGLVPKVRQRVAEVPAALVALAQGSQPASSMGAPGHGMAPSRPATDMMPGVGDVSSLKPSFPTDGAPPQPSHPQTPALGYPAYAGYPQQPPVYGQPPMPPGFQQGFAAPVQAPAHAQNPNVFAEMAVSALKNAMSSLQMLENAGILPPQRGLAYRQWELLTEVQRVLGQKG